MSTFDYEVNMKTFIREKMLIGEEGFNKLVNSKVLIFGVGGVGGYVCEALARSGIGSMTIVDHDIVSQSNINRQIIALQSTVGEYKVEVMKNRILDINPNCNVITKQMFYLPENENEFNFEEYDYIIDCIDTITAKLHIIEKAIKLNIPIISSMGAGNRFDPTKIIVTDISKTRDDKLAKVVRYELRKRGINHLKVVISLEKALIPKWIDEEEFKASGKRSTPGSSAFVPSAFGLIIASEVVKELINK